MYAKGEYIEHKYEEAFERNMKAPEQGHTRAQNRPLLDNKIQDA